MTKGHREEVYYVEMQMKADWTLKQETGTVKKGKKPGEKLQSGSHDTTRGGGGGKLTLRGGGRKNSC